MKFILIFLLSLFNFVGFSQQTDMVDFTSVSAEIEFDTKKSIILGKVHLDYTILKPTDSIFVDAKNMEVLDVSNRYLGVDFEYNGRQIIYKSNFEVGKTYTLNINYKTKPKKALYFIDWNEAINHPEYNPQIWTQGQGKYTSNWLPSIDDMNDKIAFDLFIKFNNNFEVIANGKLKQKTIGKTQTKWHYVMENPMSSYLVALAIGKYHKDAELSKSGKPLDYYYYPKDSLKVESTYRYSKQMFDFLEEEIGVAYPWQNYKQVPVKDFLYSGMENTSCTIFSDAFMVDAIEFNDNNYVNVNAHELAHQWFGDLVTETSGTHHWLQEGFATYYALLAEKDVFGEDYYYQKLYEYYLELIAQDQADKSTALLNPKSSSTTFYKKGAWALHILRDRVGDKAFKKAIKSYLELYKFKNVETKNFIDEVERFSGVNLSGFVDLWLLSPELPEDQMRLVLEKNEETAFLLTHLESPYLSYRKDSNDDYIPSSIINHLPEGSESVKSSVLEEALSKADYPGSESIILEAFNSNSQKVRQSIAFSMQTIPQKFKLNFENLLGENSYLTIEAALYKLWVNFPEDRTKYLNKTKAIIGNNNKNVRFLWLALALNTEGYLDNSKASFYNEMVEYTNSVYSFNVRQNGFTYLKELNAFNILATENLKLATKHHNWRFNSFSKKLLKQIENSEE
ncbi:M1 family metallopeptidase [Aurantibacter sp.]|uniref:M1 family metallopeptidase n=1 Tax=Aurantibacter sp. TaxID=2807103 RepID=UPI0035C80B9E